MSKRPVESTAIMTSASSHE